MKWSKGIALILLIVCSSGSSAFADRGAGQPSISPDTAAATVHRATGGRVLSVQAGGSSNASYRVKVLLQDGRVRVLRVDAHTGQLLD